MSERWEDIKINSKILWQNLTTFSTSDYRILTVVTVVLLILYTIGLFL